jgi:hypothetical protein
VNPCSVVHNAGSLAAVYAEAGWTVRAFQIASIMEVFHAGLGLAHTAHHVTQHTWNPPVE